jgi:hypothetical protein
MTASPLKLTLICPTDVAEQVIEHLLDSAPLVEGFTTFQGEGHGSDFANASPKERVRGRMARKVINTVIEAENLSPLLETLRKQFRSPHIQYWTEPVGAFGDLS